MHTEITTLKIMNGFLNHNGGGIILAATLISGTLAPGDYLLLPDGIKVPVVTCESFPAWINPNGYNITIPREDDAAFRWFELYGVVIEVEKAASR